jgi:serine/threonine protein phosphatase PrpC
MPVKKRTAPPQLLWSGQTHRGRVRQNNEDAFLALTFNAEGLRFLGKTGAATLDEGDFVFAVSDGMGGANAGEFASRIAVDRITRLLPRTFRMAAAQFTSGLNDVLLEVFDHVHAEMGRMSVYPECAGMGATLSLAVFSPGWMHFAHIGDSRIYWLPKGDPLRQVTEDHSHVGWLRRQGKLNEREARSHPRRNVLNQALGANHQLIEPQTGAVAFQAGDRFLLCTDGVNDGLWDDRLAEYLTNPASKSMSRAERIVEMAVSESGRDNCTAVVVEAE